MAEVRVVWELARVVLEWDAGGMVVRVLFYCRRRNMCVEFG